MTGGVTVEDTGLVISTGGISVSAGGIQVTGGATIYGSLYVYGTVHDITQANDLSDIRLKTDLTHVKDSLGIVSKLRGVYFTWNHTVGTEMLMLDDERHVGVVAQEVLEVLPEIVFQSGNYLRVRYIELIPVLINAINELGAKYESVVSDPFLLKQISSLRARLDGVSVTDGLLIGSGGVTIATGGMTVNGGAVLIGGLSVSGLSKFVGDVQVAGTLFYGSMNYIADERLKTKVTPLTNSLTKLSSLRGVYYSWSREVEDTGFSFDDARHIGVLAQDVLRVLPESVSRQPGSAYYGVNYVELIPLLINAVNEIADRDSSIVSASNLERIEEINNLREQDNALKRKIDSLESDMQVLKGRVSELENKNYNLERALHSIEERVHKMESNGKYMNSNILHWLLR